MMDASPRPIRSEDARRAWIIGGSLLIAVGVVPLMGGSIGMVFPFLGLLIVMASVIVTGALVVVGVLAVVFAPRSAPASDPSVQVYPPVA